MTRLGSAHMLQHCLFEGTTKRTALQTAAAIDRLGGELNGFTAREYTCVWARVPASGLGIAMDVLGDMVAAPVLADSYVERVQQVVLDQIVETADSSYEVVHDEFYRALFYEHPLGRPVLGNENSIHKINAEVLRALHGEYYRTSNIVVSAAGNVDHDELARLAELMFPDDPVFPEDPVGRPMIRSRPITPRSKEVMLTKWNRDHAEIVIGARGAGLTDPRRYPLALLKTGLGEGACSRLVQELRYGRGLASSIYSYCTNHTDTGAFGVYARCAADDIDDLLMMIRREFERMESSGLSSGEEFRRASGRFLGLIRLNLDDPNDRMRVNGRQWLLAGRVQSAAEHIRNVEAITPQDVQKVAAEVLNAPRVLAVVGPYAGRTFQVGR